MNAVEPVRVFALDCPVCREELNIPEDIGPVNPTVHIGMGRNIVVLAPCGHAIHDRCLRAGLAALNAQDPAPICAHCRTPINVQLLPPAIPVPLIDRVNDAYELARDSTPQILGEVSGAAGAAVVGGAMLATSFVIVSGASYHLVSRNAAAHGFSDVSANYVGIAGATFSVVSTTFFNYRVYREVYNAIGYINFNHFVAVSYASLNTVGSLVCISYAIDHSGMEGVLASVYASRELGATLAFLPIAHDAQVDAAMVYFIGAVTYGVVAANLGLGNLIYLNAEFVYANVSPYVPSLALTILHAKLLARIANELHASIGFVYREVFDLPSIRPIEVAEALERVTSVPGQRLGQYRFMRPIVGGTYAMIVASRHVTRTVFNVMTRRSPRTSRMMTMGAGDVVAHRRRV